MSAQSDLISQAEFCRRHRIGRTRLKKLLAEGLPRRGKKIPAARAAAWLAENLDHERKDHWSNGGDADGAASLNELRRQREMLKIDVSRLALARASGEVLERVAVQRFISARARTERDAWLAWASAASARLAAALGCRSGPDVCGAGERGARATACPG